MDIKSFFSQAQETKEQEAKAPANLTTLSFETKLRARDAKEWVKKAFAIEQKANEVMHTTNTAAGAEFIPDEVFAESVIDILPTRSSLLPLLPGNHGVGLPKKYTSAALGLSVDDMLFEGKSEWTTGYAYQTEDDHTIQKAETAQISLEQKSFIAEVNISDEQLKYNAVNTEAYVRERLASGMALTVDNLIINGDSETGATGNVNLDDAAPTAGTYYLSIDGGIRERAINGSYTVNVGTLAASDYSDIIGVLGEYGIFPEDLLFLQHVSVNKKTRALDELETVDKFGPNATIVKGTLGKIYGVDVVTHRGVPKTEADGKVSTTAANNTLGQIVCVYKPAVQFGFGQDFKLEVVRVAGYGFRLVATFDFAFKIIDSENSLTDVTVAAGINVTVA